MTRRILTKQLTILKECTTVESYVFIKGLVDRDYYLPDYTPTEENVNEISKHDEFLRTCIEEYLINHNTTLQEVLNSL